MCPTSIEIGSTRGSVFTVDPLRQEDVDLGTGKIREPLLQWWRVEPLWHVSDTRGPTAYGDQTIPTTNLLPNLLDPLTPPRVREAREAMDESRFERSYVPPPIGKPRGVLVGKRPPESSSKIGNRNDDHVPAQSLRPVVGLGRDPARRVCMLENVLSDLAEDHTELYDRGRRIAEGIGQDRTRPLLHPVHHLMDVAVRSDRCDLQQDVRWP